MGVSPRCPSGEPHYWLVDGQNAECKLCGATRHDLQDSPNPTIGSRPIKPVSHKPVRYRKRIDYLFLKGRILKVYAETQSIAQTSQAFQPPIPPTTLRHLLEQWRLGPTAQIVDDEIVMELEPNTARLRIRGKTDFITSLSEGVAHGHVEILAEGHKMVDNRYTVMLQKGEG